MALHAASPGALHPLLLCPQAVPSPGGTLGRLGTGLPLPTRALRAGSIAGRGAEWTSWFNIDHPGGDGDFESLDAIRFYYRGRVCERPVAIQARTTAWELPEEVGEVVHASPKKGFRCLNKEQPQGKTCSNYHIRFLCPLGECWNPHIPLPGPHQCFLGLHTHCCALL